MEFIHNSSGTETLQRLHSMIRYSKWIYDLIKPFINGRVLEIGCGLGAMTRHLVNDDHQLVSIDINDSHIRIMRETFKNQPNLTILKMDILEENGKLQPASFDTVMLINVLEHIEKESQTIEKIYNLLSDNANFILFVPAYQWLYGSLDTIVGHVRRYNKNHLQSILTKANFKPYHYRYMNTLGVFGWFLNSKVLKKNEFSLSQIKLFDFLIPLISGFEKIITPPFGQSILVVVKKE